MDNNNSSPNSSYSTAGHSGRHTIHQNAVFALECVEACPLGLLFFVGLLNGWLVLRSALLHFNLKAILLTQSLFICFYALTRSLQLLLVFTKMTSLISSFIAPAGLFLITNGNLIGHAMIIERAIATVKARQYEKWTKLNWFSMAWISIMLLIFVVEICDAAPTGKFNIFTIANHLALLLSIVELIAFFFLNMHNRQSYNRFNNIRSSNTHQYRLSERYQLLQNIYSGQQLGPSFFFHLINILCSNIVLFFSLYVKVPMFMFGLVVQIIFVLHAFCKLGIEITVITFHPRLKRNLRHMLSGLGNCAVHPLGRSAAIADSAQQPQPQGAPANWGAEEGMAEQERHFKMLEHIWR